MLNRSGSVNTGEHPLLSAFREHHALQCGFCTPGMIMSSLELLRRVRSPA
jgi:carbon-monoxide dehydrogenase small subunit